MAYPWECLLYVDGVRVPDRAADIAAGPVALDGLSVSWGRDETGAQPDPGTCAFDLVDLKGGAGTSSVVHAGSTVAVQARGAVHYAPSENLFPNPDMSTWAPIPPATVPSGRLAPVGTPAPTISTVVVSGLGTFGQVVQPNPTKLAGIAILPYPIGSGSWTNWPDFSAWPSIWMKGKGATTLAANTFRLVVYAYDPVAKTLTRTPLVGNTLTGNGTPNTISASFNGPFTGPTYDGKKPVWVFECDPMAAPAWEDLTPAWTGLTNNWNQWGSGVASTGRFNITTVYTGQFGKPGIDWVNTAAVWGGRVTDLEMTPEGDGVHVQCTAVDQQAEYAHRFIGDEPWLSETVDARVARIATLASIPPVAVAAPKNGWLLTWRDIDNQSSMDLLREIADSVDAILWNLTTPDGQTLYLEDPGNRVGLQTLGVTGGVVVITESTNAIRTIYLDGCDVLAEPTVFRQDTENIVSIVDVQWNEQALNEDGLPEPIERHVVRTDQPSVDAYGTRRAGVSTQLATQANATTVADATLARAREAKWVVPTLVWDTSTGETTDRGQYLFRLLDGTARVAAPISLDHLPEWSPIGESMVCWLEGGKYAFNAGFWELALAVSPATAAGKAANWNNLKSAIDQAVANSTWAMWDPSIDWVDMQTVSIPSTLS